ncbi:hypothetical protein KQX54_008143 [Cotesia glomerata]|uniref:Uncharacterized protein n=1 Tax=Cotesia glomerata TaxID=32391 RepID=A0AAV7IKH4_COTGL|nr:hypothetical protein KQX54_008143 [Cotesia glomerata]
MEQKIGFLQFFAKNERKILTNIDPKDPPLPEIIKRIYKAMQHKFKNTAIDVNVSKLNSHDLARIDYLARMTGLYSPIPEQDRSINITCKTSNTSLLTQRLERGSRFSGNLTEEDLCALNITHTVPHRCIFTAQLTQILNLLYERQKLIVQIGANGYEAKSIENLMDYIIENLNKSIQKLINAVETESWWDDGLFFPDLSTTSTISPLTPSGVEEPKQTFPPFPEPSTVGDPFPPPKHQDEVAEWLRRWTANPMCSARVGSNPILVGVFFW